MIEFSCTSCGKRYKLEDQMGGKRAKCKCGNVLLVPPMTIDPALMDSSKAPAAPPPPPRPAPPTPPPPIASRAGVQQPVATEAAGECPSCGAAMAPNAVLCIECGFDKRTGKRLSGV
ncbi:MAG TPA: hypothetical protein VFE47_17400 [Tepidisphaeraceae bacterium]|nr:hypothetical protein [Tepidisphaeraceae bacterium]